MVTEIAQLCIKATVWNEKGHQYVQQFLLFLFLHVKGDTNISKGFEEIETACATISAHPVKILDTTAATACQSVPIFPPWHAAKVDTFNS